MQYATKQTNNRIYPIKVLFVASINDIIAKILKIIKCILKSRIAPAMQIVNVNNAKIIE